MIYPRYTIVKAVQTCYACPSQWDAWTDRGQYLYLRFRHGFGAAYVDGTDGEQIRIAEFTTDHSLDGLISLEEFCRCAGLRLRLEA